MLHQRTSSANNLRIESSRRHAIRNLRAKVRSLLPPDNCMREQLRAAKAYRMQQPNQEHSPESKRHLEFEKLSEAEIEEINENKHYFLGSEQSIACYDQYLYEHYPHLKSQWLPPTPPRPLAFPTAEFGSKVLLGAEQMQRKRTSCSKSLGLEQKERNLSRQRERDCDRYFDRQSKGLDRTESCMNRRQALQQQLKIKRQISSVHLQRQQQLAEVKRNNFLRDKTEAKLLRPPFIRVSASRFEEFEVAELASRLRRVCLQRGRGAGA